MGVMLLTLGQFGREKADTLSCIPFFIDALGGCDTVDLFLVTWRWQIAPFVHRYPSPVGRLGHTPCQAPDFLRSRTVCYRDGQGFAQNPCCDTRGWNLDAIRGVTPAQATTCKGADTWTFTRSDRRRFSPLLRCWASRPAVTRWANRPFSAELPGVGQPSRPGAILSPGLRLGLRPTSPIARPIRNAADASARPNYSRISTVRTQRPGGLFHAIAAGCVPGQEKTDGKGQTCSTRS